MASPTSTTAPNPIPGSSGAGFAVAPVAAAAQNPMMQIDQKKVPVFHGEPDKDSLTIVHWCARIDGLKDAHNLSDEVTFANASAALFGIASRTAANWAIIYKADHRKTWTYLKKKMLSHFGNITGSRAFIDAMFGIQQRTDTFVNLDKFNADVVDAFEVVKQILPAPDAPPQGNYTAEQCHTREKLVHETLLNKMCMAFMTQLLPPELRTKVLEKNPDTVAQSTEYAKEAQNLLRDKSRPIGTGSGIQKPRVLAIQEDLQEAGSLDDLILNAVERAFKKKNFNPGNANNRNQNRNGAAQGTRPKSQKQCSYCRKTGHSQEDCYSRKNDKAPCLTVKGDPYYPSSDADWKGPPSRSTKQAAPIVSKGQDFPHWV